MKNIMMPLPEGIIELGCTILAQQDTYFHHAEVEDLQHISEMKATILGIETYLRSKAISEETITQVTTSLQRHAQALFLKRCAEMAQEAGNPFDEESDHIYFAYIYQHGDYPE